MNYCKTCNQILPQGHGYKSDRKYCNYTCYMNRNTPSREVIIKELNTHRPFSITAELLGISRQSLYRAVKIYGLIKVVRWE